jgi:AcrR family transcriptional regulator
MAAGARRGSPLTPEEIHATALRLVNEGGVEALSMRKLAAALDVNPMSLYHHVENKTALIEQICLTMADRLEIPVMEGAPWQERLRALGHAYRRLATTYPALWTYVRTHPEVIAARQGGLWDVFLPILRDAGVPEEEVLPTADVLHAFVTGLILHQRNGLGARSPEAMDRTFDTALDLIIGGLSSRLREGSLRESGL